MSEGAELRALCLFGGGRRAAAAEQQNRYL